jgi:hypothetical protein
VAAPVEAPSLEELLRRFTAICSLLLGFRLNFVQIIVRPPQVHAKFANGYFGYKR